MAWTSGVRRIRQRLRKAWVTSVPWKAHGHLDEPHGTITTTAVHVRGWVVGASDDEVTLTLNGRPRPLAFYRRPDVERAFAGQRARGFSTFARLADLGHPPAVTIDVRATEGSLLSKRFTVGDGARAAAAEEKAVLAHHRAWLADKLICVRCGAPLSPATACCTACGHDYRAEGAIDARPPELQAAPEIEFVGAVCSHAYDGDVQRVLAKVEEAGGMALDCGAGWRRQVRRSVITTEVYPYPGTDVLAVSQRLPFGDDVFDAVLSLHVLEHVPDPFACARELLRVLKPGGTLFAATPMIVPEHGFPHHYFNPTREGLLRLFGSQAQGARVFVPEMGHPINGVHSILSVYADALPPRERARFLDLKIGEILATPIERWLPADICRSLGDEGRTGLAANFCIELVKKPV